MPKIDHMTNDQLLAMRDEICADPKNHANGLFMYSPSARKKLDKIDRAITNNLADARKASGNPVIADGYSGRKTNRR